MFNKRTSGVYETLQKIYSFQFLTSVKKVVMYRIVMLALVVCFYTNVGAQNAVDLNLGNGYKAVYTNFNP